MEKKKLTLGLIINPVAGLGGPMALKGSDYGDIRSRAAKSGVFSQSGSRTSKALESLLPLAEDIHFITVSGEMGQDVLAQMGFSHEVVWQAPDKNTTADDTLNAALSMLKREPDIILFSGGDGTARNIADAIGVGVPALGIPAGVKIHSSVYAASPTNAGQLLYNMAKGLPTTFTEREVMDIDEDAFRKEKVNSRLYGYLQVPTGKHLLQNRKMGGFTSEKMALRGIARRVVDDMLPGVVYMLGGGTTVAAVMQEMRLDGSLLGVDIVQNGSLLAADATAADIQRITMNVPCKAVITIIGGQGHILGRGNQQMGPAVLSRMKKDDLIIIATKEKLLSLAGSPMRLDTGDRELDKRLSGYYRVIVGYDETVVYAAE